MHTAVFLRNHEVFGLDILVNVVDWMEFFNGIDHWLTDHLKRVDLDMVVLLLKLLFQGQIQALHHDEVIILLDSMRIYPGEIFEFLQLF